jgi:hypothetical protein
MNSNSNMPAMPQPIAANNDGVLDTNEYRSGNEGLTKREHFAGLAMQSYMIMCAGANYAHVHAEEAAQEAVEYADALLAELDKVKL